MQEFESVFTAALDACRFDRPAACVATAMEICCRQGWEAHSSWDIRKFTGQRLCVIERAFRDLHEWRMVDTRSWYGSYALIRPIRPKVPQTAPGPFNDPIDLLRINQTELEAIPDEDLRASTVEAALKSLEDALDQQESDIVAEIKCCNALIETEERVRDQAVARERELRDRAYKLISELSQVRLQRWHPFAQKHPNC